MDESYADTLTRSYAAVAGELPADWTLSLRCAVRTMAAMDRSPEWIAVAESPMGSSVHAIGSDPERALAALHHELNRKPIGGVS
jgi:hypothetical protein